jgi:uncharacterized protein
MSSPLAQVTESARFQALDVLRGFAVLGILLINIQLFAMPSAAHDNPTALGEPSTLDFVIWSTSHLLAEQKFMTIFALLFGAGVLLMSMKAAEHRMPAARLHYRRMFWLLVFGLIHAYLLWDGDILVLYAVCGFFVYPAHRLGTRGLLALGLAMLAIGSLISIVFGVALGTASPEVVRAWSEFWHPPPARIAEEIAALRGSWLVQLSWRARNAWEFHSSDLWSWGIWRATGLMLAGMALLKWGVVTGERTPSFYRKLGAIGIGAGVPLVACGLVQNNATGWNVRDGYFLASQWNYWGSVLIALGWIGWILRFWKTGTSRWLISRLAAVGRMAFTCYIAETLLCTTLFYGRGFGLFGRVDRLGQVLVTLSVWLLLLLSARRWLEHFRFGPLEWLWRTLTYGRVEPIMRAAGSSVPVM